MNLLHDDRNSLSLLQVGILSQGSAAVITSSPILAEEGNNDHEELPVAEENRVTTHPFSIESNTVRNINFL